jgi:hypothetical protein
MIDLEYANEPELALAVARALSRRSNLPLEMERDQNGDVTVRAAADRLTPKGRMRIGDRRALSKLLGFKRLVPAFGLVVKPHERIYLALRASGEYQDEGFRP